MTTMTSTFRIHALPGAELAHLRKTGHDDFGNPLVVRVVNESEARLPLRCCLRRTRAGDRVALIAWRPAGGMGAYAEVGPIFIHADSCEGYAEVNECPKDYRKRPAGTPRLRRGGPDRRCGPSPSDHAEIAIQGLLARPDVVVIHTRNVTYGCYMFAVTRPGAAQPA